MSVLLTILTETEIPIPSLRSLKSAIIIMHLAHWGKTHNPKEILILQLLAQKFFMIKLPMIHRSRIWLHPDSSQNLTPWKSPLPPSSLVLVPAHFPQLLHFAERISPPGMLFFLSAFHIKWSYPSFTTEFRDHSSASPHLASEPGSDHLFL